jgi:hypothetical protein
MSMTREQLLRVQSSARVFQQRADDAFASWNMRAPAPVLGEDPDDYRRKLMILAKNQLPENHELRKVTVKRIPGDALDNFEKMYYDACRDAGSRNDSAPPGQMRMVEKVNPQNGQKFIEFLGTRSFIHDFPSYARRVVGFRTPEGLWNTGGRYVR